MTEQKIQFLIQGYLKKDGWLVNKLMAVTQGGTPDLIAHKQGKTLYIEVKKPGGRLSRIQEYRIAELRNEGIDVLVTDNLQDVKDHV